MKNGLLFIIIIMMFVGGCSNEETYTNDIYLIPSGYEGTIIVFYGISKEPKLEKEGEFSVIPVKEEFLESMARSELPHYGVTLTSTPYENGGSIHNDKYFYVDSDGQRTPIQKECIHHRGNGAFDRENGEVISYSDLEVTISGCGQDFWFDGKEIYYDQLKEVKDYWFNELY